MLHLHKIGAQESVLLFVLVIIIFVWISLVVAYIKQSKKFKKVSTAIAFKPEERE